MTARAWPVLTRIHPVTLGRLFHAHFGARRRAPNVEDQGAYRDQVASELNRLFGVPLPRGLDWLVAAAQGRAISVSDLIAFLAWAFDLEPLTGR
jgi:hypothetical protein